MLPGRSEALIRLLGRSAHLRLDVAQQEEPNGGGAAEDLSHPEGRFPAVVLGDGAEGQPRQETADWGENTCGRNVRTARDPPEEPAPAGFTLMRRQEKRGGALTVGREGHDGVRGPAVLGRGALIGYDSKQGDRSVRREAKQGAQGEDPHLRTQTGEMWFLWGGGVGHGAVR